MQQIKKASQRKEMEVNFEEKRLNLSVEEEKELNKENEQRRACVQHPGMMQKDPYYDQAAYVDVFTFSMIFILRYVMPGTEAVTAL